MVELLEKITLDVFLSGNNIPEEKLATIKSKLLIPENEKVIGFFDDSIRNNGKEGIAITDDAIYWKTTGSTVDGKNKNKGSIHLEELNKYSSKIEKKMLNVQITLKNPDLNSNGPFEYMIQMAITDEEFITAIKQVFGKLTHLSEDPTVKNTEDISKNTNTSTASTPKSYELEKFEAYISPNGGDDETVLTYKKKFKPYNTNGVEKFAFNWSWSGFLLGFIFLFHRKAYKEAGIVFAGSFLLSLILPVVGPIISFVCMGVLSPYLLYKRFKSIESKIESTIDDREKRIESFKEMGGTNLLTSSVVMIVSTLVVLAIIVGIIMMIF